MLAWHQYRILRKNYLLTSCLVPREGKKSESRQLSLRSTSKLLQASLVQKLLHLLVLLPPMVHRWYLRTHMCNLPS
eukprot:21127_4